MWQWENWENVEKYSPSRADLCGNWATPMLVIHSEKDYRCVLSDGIAAFHVLQKLGVPSQFLNFPDEVSLTPISLSLSLVLGGGGI